MKVFIGGITGSGKSTLANWLKARSIVAYDADYDNDISYWADKITAQKVPEPVDFSRPLSWMWDEANLLHTLGKSATNIFILGNASNQADFYSHFDALRILIADNETLRRRISARENNAFGKTPSQMNWVMQEKNRLVNELLAAGAIAINASQPIDTVGNDLLRSLANDN